MVTILTELECEKMSVDLIWEAYTFLNSPKSKLHGLIRSEFLNAIKDDFSEDGLNGVSTIFIYEDWLSMHDYETYVRSKTFCQVLSLFEMSLIKPIIRIIDHDHEMGYSWIESLLESNHNI